MTDMTDTSNGRTDAAVRLDGVTFSYGEASMAFDLTVEAGSVTAIMGPSGSGKSTLLNLVAGFETPKSGRVLIDDRDMTHEPPAARPLSMVFQENNLFAHLDVAQNVGLGRSPALRLTPSDRTAVSEALVRTGLGGKEHRLPRELSGGERQRVALARVLVRDRPGAFAGRTVCLAWSCAAGGYAWPRRRPACRTPHDSSVRHPSARRCAPNRPNDGISGGWDDHCHR